MDKFMIMIANARGKTDIGSLLANQQDHKWLGLGLLLLMTIAAFDVATGLKLRITVLYLVPLLMVTWVLGRLFGILMSVVACNSWAYLDLIAGRYVEDPSLLYWDWGTVLVGFSVLVIGLTELRKSLCDARFQSRKDALTGLLNKGGFYQVLGAELEVCRRYQRMLSVAYIDSDNFKRVNDEFGHEVGDELLRVVARTMLGKLRTSDLPGRLGGDEFAVMLPETNAEGCRMVVEVLQQRLLHAMQERGWPVTFSIGIATFHQMPASIEDMVRQADKLMYAVKHSSKGAIKQQVFES